jgi:hypothetical protein
VAWYANEGNRSQIVAGTWLMLIGGVVFLWFLGILRERLAAAEGRAGLFTAVGFGSGLVASAIWFVAAVFSMTVAYTVGETDEFVVDPNTERLVRPPTCCSSSERLWPACSCWPLPSWG